MVDNSYGLGENPGCDEPNTARCNDKCFSQQLFAATLATSFKEFDQPDVNGDFIEQTEGSFSQSRLGYFIFGTATDPSNIHNEYTQAGDDDFLSLIDLVD